MAAKTYPYLRVVINGIIHSSQTWSTAWATKFNPNTSQADLTAWLELVAGDVAGWWSTGNGCPQDENSADTDLYQLKAYGYAANDSRAIIQAVWPLMSLPGQSTTPGTARDSLVVSLYGNQPGAHYRGRMYVPTTGPQLGTDHNFAVGTAQRFATNTRDLLVATGNRILGGVDPHPVIASSLPTAPQVYHVRADTLPDTQRRRSDNIAVIGSFDIGITYP